MARKVSIILFALSVALLAFAYLRHPKQDSHADLRRNVNLYMEAEAARSEEVTLIDLQIWNSSLPEAEKWRQIKEVERRANEEMSRVHASGFKREYQYQFLKDQDERVL